MLHERVDKKMFSANNRVSKIGLVELPEFELIAPDGARWNNIHKGFPLISKQILLSHLQSGGFDAQLVNLQLGNDEEVLGTVTWRGKKLTKKYTGTKISRLDPDAYDVWGVSNNFTQYRELTCLIVKHLASTGKPVAVGGADAIGAPHIYIQAGATAVIEDKSGAANWAIYDYLAGREPREKLSGVLLADGTQYPKSLKPLHPEDWPIPSAEVIQQCFGTKVWDWELLQANLTPVSGMMFDMGCDRTCDFCQTPTYGIGYKRMSPQKALRYCYALKEAGARAIACGSDQFLGRVLFPQGREEVLELVRGIREMEMPIAWFNGIELRKATLGRGRNYDNSDLTPDRELLETIWSWDGKVGCCHAFIPAERPVEGTKSYKKLLPWKHHCEMMRAIVRTGVPHIDYSVIVGLPDDNHESLAHLEEALWEICQDLKTINPQLDIWLGIQKISPLPGTPQEQSIRQKGLLRFEDPAIIGGMFTPCADTLHLSYEEVADWQERLMAMNSIFHTPVPSYTITSEASTEKLVSKALATNAINN